MPKLVSTRPPNRCVAAHRKWLYALPEGRMPSAVACRGECYDHVETFKHDFFAATGLYRGPAGLCVLKLGRRSELFSLPMEWSGALLAQREAWFYERLVGTTGVPRYIGRVGRTGFLHEFVPGHPLGRSERVADAFFDQLAALLGTIHARGMAYVDLNKRENILVGDDGRPYLIDFQISLAALDSGPLRPASAALLTRFQHADRYHLLKHKRRLRPDLLTTDERAVVENLSVWIRLHRRIARPITDFRRRTLARFRKSAPIEVAGSSAK